MGAYKKPQQRKKEESKWLRGDGDQNKLIDLRSQKWLAVGFRKARRQDVSDIALVVSCMAVDRIL